MPPAVVAAAPETAPSLESAFILARAAVAPVARPSEVLAGGGSVDAKLAAIDALHSKIPTEPKAAQAAALKALAAAASDPRQPAEVRAKALMFTGYAMPQVNDDAARSKALPVLLAALKDPAFRIFALRGLGPACHDLPESDEPAYLNALLDLLDGPVAGEERETALVALFSFIGTRDDLSRRAPALVAALDARLLGPLEANPALFVLSARNTPGARAMAVACVWASARHRQTLGDPAPAARVHALLVRLAAIETDPTTLEWVKTYRDAPAPTGPALRDSTTSRVPAGPDEP